MLKKLLTFLITILLFTSTASLAKQVSEKLSTEVKQDLDEVTGTAPSDLQAQLHQQYLAANSRLGLSLYRPTYVLPAYYTQMPADDIYGQSTPDNQKLNREEFKVQFSLMVPIWHRPFHLKRANLNLAYTQKMYWQVYTNSAYFRETNYQPELFLSYHVLPNWLVDLGISHQSNGRGGNFERSWNRAYATVHIAKQHWLLTLQPWLLIFKSGSSDLHNPDIKRYLGNGQLIASYKWQRNVFSITTRNNLQSFFARGFVKVTWSRPIWHKYHLYAQALSGYGQSLIEYNHYTNAFGLGIALNDWL